MSASHPKYRRDIDGLRAVAVLSVLFFHGFPSALPGGLVGVDIFFVISGYLISTILLMELRADTFSFLEFYQRRVLRIFPALCVVLASSYIIGWLCLVPEEFRQLGNHIASAAGFISNFTLRQEAGYFDVAAELKPLLHLWSLAIEEQFYIFFPLLLFLTARLRLRAIYVIAPIALASFLWNLLKIGPDPARTFYYPQTRIWELLLGALLAYMVLERKVSPSKPIAQLLSALGAGLIAIALFSISKASPFPGWWALLPTMGAAFLLAAGNDGWLNRQVLSSRPLVAVGLISYPLYLWHWPALSIAHILKGEVPTASVRGALLVLSLLLSWLTYRFVEKPLRFGQRKSAITSALLGCMVLLAAGGLLTKKANGLPSRFPREMQALLNVPEHPGVGWRRHRCFLGPEDPASTSFAPECSASGKKPLIFLWGDSYAAALFPGLSSIAEKHSMSLAQFTIGACPPILERHDTANPLCDRRNEAALEKIHELSPNFLVIASDWRLYDYWPTLSRTIAKLKSTSRTKILLVGPPPEWQGHLPKIIWAYWAKNFRHTLPPEYMREGLETRTANMDKEMRAFAEKEGIDYVSLLERLCNQDGCRSRDGEKIYAFDNGHLSPAAAEYVASSLVAYFMKAGP